MGRPKKVVPPLGDDTAKRDMTTVKTVKVKEVVKELSPLKKGDSFLFIKDGNEVYYTRSTANVVFQRNSASMVIPLGSAYIPPKGSKCDGCG